MYVYSMTYSVLCFSSKPRMQKQQNLTPNKLVILHKMQCQCGLSAITSSIQKKKTILIEDILQCIHGYKLKDKKIDNEQVLILITCNMYQLITVNTLYFFILSFIKCNQFYMYTNLSQIFFDSQLVQIMFCFDMLTCIHRSYYIRVLSLSIYIKKDRPKALLHQILLWIVSISHLKHPISIDNMVLAFNNSK